MSTLPSLSLVIPVYGNEESIADLLVAVAALNQSIPNGIEAVFVVDGSPDRSYDLLRQALTGQAFQSKLVLLSRNFGSFAAIKLGLEVGTADHFAVMAADLQEPHELVEQFAQTLLSDKADVVLGVRDSRDDPFVSRLFSTAYWRLYRRFVVRDIPPGGVDIFGCNRVFRDTLLTLDERHSSLIGQVFWLGFRRHFIPYQRRKRQHGKSAWTFAKKLRYLSDSVFAFTDLPIRLLTYAGAIGATISGLIGVFAVIARLFGNVPVPGYTAIMLVMTFLGSLILFGVGVVGSYAWRAYENTKQRPSAIPMAVHSYGPKHD